MPKPFLKDATEPSTKRSATPPALLEPEATVNNTANYQHAIFPGMNYHRHVLFSIIHNEEAFDALQFVV